MRRLKIAFIHDGLANYPSKMACSRFLQTQGFEVTDCCENDILRLGDLSNTVLWYMMGFYPKRNSNALAVIHEYRSPSLGRFRKAKDLLKKYRNHRPDFRIFQSEDVKKIYSFKDGVASGLLELSVPDDILNYRSTDISGVSSYDFCYVGAIEDERRIREMLDGFVRAYGRDASLLMIGKVCDGIDASYSDYRNINFVGKISQVEVFNLVIKCKYAVCFFPYHFPHSIQPPTKLYEYAALGMKIVANDAPANLHAIEKYNINACVFNGNEFPSLDDLEKNAVTNVEFDPAVFYWSSSIERSGVMNFLKSLL
jgi:glycosyltransferase involved in cell wall biosynthesis